LNSVKEHTETITDMQFSRDQSHFITSSKDHSAIIWETETLVVLKKFVPGRPVNSAAMSPTCPHIMLGGGQDAMSVTTTSAKQEKFETR
jgi:translation initiation factor 3 subunit I